MAAGKDEALRSVYRWREGVYETASAQRLILRRSTQDSAGNYYARNGGPLDSFLPKTGQLGEGTGNNRF